MLCSWMSKFQHFVLNWVQFLSQTGGEWRGQLAFLNLTFLDSSCHYMPEPGERSLSIQFTPHKWIWSPRGSWVPQPLIKASCLYSFSLYHFHRGNKLFLCRAVFYCLLNPMWSGQTKIMNIYKYIFSWRWENSCSLKSCWKRLILELNEFL